MFVRNYESTRLIALCLQTMHPFQIIMFVNRPGGGSRYTPSGPPGHNNMAVRCLQFQRRFGSLSGLPLGSITDSSFPYGLSSPHFPLPLRLNIHRWNLNEEYSLVLLSLCEHPFLQSPPVRFLIRFPYTRDYEHLQRLLLKKVIQLLRFVFY